MSPFRTEADLCAAFIAAATKDGKWRAYAETAGFDILLVRVSDGAQIGIEAKLALNVKVLSQALPRHLEWDAGMTGPDFRAVLVPDGGAQIGLRKICGALGIVVIEIKPLAKEPGRSVACPAFGPVLPVAPGHVWDRELWHDWVPVHRCDVPRYVPDVTAGVPSPVALTQWKVRAIKLAILLEDRPVTRADFKALGLSPSRWTDPYSGWLRKADGGYVPGKNMPDLRAQHPRNYEEIKADRAKWAPPACSSAPVLTVSQPDLLAAPAGSAA